jgi:hypothetical protein
VGTATTTSPKADVLHTTLDLTGASNGPWNVVVTDPGSATDRLASAFRTIGDFTVDSLFPRIGDQNAMVPVTIYGSDLFAPALVRLKQSGIADIVIPNTTVAANGTSLQATFNLSLPIGPLQVEVQNGDGIKKVVPGGFEVATPLRIQSVYPNLGSSAGTAQVTVGGTGMRSGASVVLRRSGETDIVGDQVTVDPDGTMLHARFDLQGRAEGLWDVVVQNLGSLPATVGNVFRITSLPVVTSIDPHVGSTADSLPVVIGGLNFDSGATARLNRAGQTSIVGSGTVVASGGGSLTVIFDLTGAAPGPGTSRSTTLATSSANWPRDSRWARARASRRWRPPLRPTPAWRR